MFSGARVFSDARIPRPGMLQSERSLKYSLEPSSSARRPFLPNGTCQTAILYTTATTRFPAYGSRRAGLSVRLTLHNSSCTSLSVRLPPRGSYLALLRTRLAPHGLCHAAPSGRFPTHARNRTRVPPRDSPRTVPAKLPAPKMDGSSGIRPTFKAWREAAPLRLSGSSRGKLPASSRS